MPSSSSIASLTLREQSGPSTFSARYTFDDAKYDAAGKLGSQYEASPPPASNTVFLWESGCRANDSWNCTAACMDEEIGPTMLWNSTTAMFTLQNCLINPLVALSAAQGWLLEEPVGLLEKYEIYGARSDLEAFNISEWVSNNEPLAEMPWGTSSLVVNSCTRAFCAEVYSDPRHSECVHVDLMYPTDLRCGDPTAYQCQELVCIK